MEVGRHEGPQQGVWVCVRILFLVLVEALGLGRDCQWKELDVDTAAAAARWYLLAMQLLVNITHLPFCCR